MLDVEDIFNNIVHRQILSGLIEAGFKGSLIALVEDYMKQRTIKVRVKGRACTKNPKKVRNQLNFWEKASEISASKDVNLKTSEFLSICEVPDIAPWEIIEPKCNLLFPTEEHDMDMELKIMLNDKYKNYIEIYTDGSKLESPTAVGAAFWIPKMKVVGKYKLYPEISVFVAEAYAILKSIGVCRKTLLRYRMKDDPVMKDIFERSAGNAQHCSPRIQHELIDICGYLITEKVVEQDKSDNFFTIHADETTDISRQEQMALGLRFMDSETLQIRGEFIGFAVVEDLRGESLGQFILSRF
ncbi:hypothetical protein QYM36_000395 [Artemia franciscana]|uniref:DUF4371 domain-containing protein n=1 Tax=Artemia franciscana TaxID=6661 RepID=A0AA88I810_ARTSF|nr:hypothetical protein QYM36_000395 [Artemia franciscana]